VLGVLTQTGSHQTEADIDIFMRFIRAAMYAASERGYDVLVTSKNADDLRGDVLIDAAVVMDVRMQDDRLPLLRDWGIPTVLIGMPDDTHQLSAVDLDFEAAARAMVAYLVGLGHRHLAVLTSPEPDDGPLSWQARFQRGFEGECRRAEVHGFLATCPDSHEGVLHWLDGVLAAMPDVSGILVAGASAQSHLTAVTRERGLSAPRDLSIIAVAPDRVFGLEHPDITLVDLPGERMVAWAVTQVLDELAGAPSGRREFIPPVITVRASTGPAPTSGRN
jgi:DNA-binding LacI/PurR family transcriptional regulator